MSGRLNEIKQKLEWIVTPKELRMIADTMEQQAKAIVAGVTSERKVYTIRNHTATLEIFVCNNYLYDLHHGYVTIEE